MQPLLPASLDIPWEHWEDRLGVKMHQDPRMGERKRVRKQAMLPLSRAFLPRVPCWAGGCGDGLGLALSGLSVLFLSVLGSAFL